MKCNFFSSTNLLSTGERVHAGLRQSDKSSPWLRVCHLRQRRRGGQDLRDPLPRDQRQDGGEQEGLAKGTAGRRRHVKPIFLPFAASQPDIPVKVRRSNTLPELISRKHYRYNNNNVHYNRYNSLNQYYGSMDPYVSGTLTDGFVSRTCVLLRSAMRTREGRMGEGLITAATTATRNQLTSTYLKATTIDTTGECWETLLGLNTSFQSCPIQ